MKRLADFIICLANPVTEDPLMSYLYSEQKPRLRRRLYDILEAHHDGWGRLINIALVALILINVFVFVMGTVPAWHDAYGYYFDLLHHISIIIFTIEYILRVWVCVEVLTPDDQSPWRVRLHFMLTPVLLVDLLSILPFYLSFFIDWDLVFLRILRLFLFFKLARYSPALQSLARVFMLERRALLGALMVMAALLLFASTGIYYLEHRAQPETFGSIPASAWWAMTTLTTVGYGDVVPITPLGKVFGGLIMLLGLCMFALPVAIIATGFAQETTRREFVVTWAMVAQLPLFHGLKPVEIAEILSLLQSHSFAPGGIIYKKDETAQAIYFIVSGDVDLAFENDHIKLSKGDYFGELAILQSRIHSATAIAQTRCNLLLLPLDSLEYLLKRNPQITERLQQNAKRRKPVT